MPIADLIKTFLARDIRIAEGDQNPCIRGKNIVAILGLFCTLYSHPVFCQTTTIVSQQQMEKVYNEIKTPYKYGLVVVPTDDTKKSIALLSFAKAAIGT